MKRTAFPILYDRVRKIPKSFSWIDRRIINDNFLQLMSREEIALYFFLVTVSNRYGMSFYGTSKICHFTGLAPDELETARRGLVKKGLIAFRAPFYQALSLPESSSGRAQRKK